MGFAAATEADVAALRPGILVGVVVAPAPLRGRLTASLAQGGLAVAGVAEPEVLPLEAVDSVVHYALVACERPDARARSAARPLRDWWSGIRVVAVAHAADASVADALAAE